MVKISKIKESTLTGISGDIIYPITIDKAVNVSTSVQGRLGDEVVNVEDALIKIGSKVTALDSLLNNDVEGVIDSFKNVTDFLAGVTDDETLSGKLNEINTNKQNKLAYYQENNGANIVVSGVSDGLIKTGSIYVGSNKLEISHHSSNNASTSKLSFQDDNITVVGTLSLQSQVVANDAYFTGTIHAARGFRVSDKGPILTVMSDMSVIKSRETNPKDYPIYVEASGLMVNNSTLATSEYVDRFRDSIPDMVDYSPTGVILRHAGNDKNLILIAAAAHTTAGVMTADDYNNLQYVVSAVGSLESRIKALEDKKVLVTVNDNTLEITT